VIAFVAASIICAAIPLPAGIALALGIGAALAFGNPHAGPIKSLASRLLGVAVVGLGAGTNLQVVAQTGANGLVITLVGITATMTAGYLIGKALRVADDCSLLITTGTAICGGSAIAAMAPAIKARGESISVSLVTVFCLNAVALFIFPPWGRWLGLSQDQFGLWAALAIHDTSSVVGAASQFGDRALEVGTTVKLARALWIAPLVIVVNAVLSRRAGAGFKPAMPPWFIFGFIIVSALVTFVPGLSAAGAGVAAMAKRLLVMVLFLIGATLTREHLVKAGFRPFIQGFFLWVLVTASTLAFILVKEN
jgi:uncharacterized integral membrane protein (TIGR00698 family)